MQVAEADASPPTEPERTVYREPPSPSAPFIGTDTASPPRALLSINCAALSPEPRAAPPWPAAAASQAPGQERACTRATARSRGRAAVTLPRLSAVRQA
jgi:hypothetical protein